MYFVVHELSRLIGGSREEASVSCWILTDSFDVALERSRRCMADEGWRIASTVECYPISEEDYPQGHFGLQYFRQALVDQEVFVVYLSDSE